METKTILKIETALQHWSLPCCWLFVSGPLRHHTGNNLPWFCHSIIRSKSAVQDNSIVSKTKMERKWQKCRSWSSWPLLSGRTLPPLASEKAWAEWEEACAGEGCSVPRSVERFSPEQSNQRNYQTPEGARDICLSCAFSLIPLRYCWCLFFCCSPYAHKTPISHLLLPAVHYRALLALSGIIPPP